MLHIIILYACYALVASPTKNQALEAVFGTSDPEELQHMADNPKKWLEEREKQLFTPGRLMTNPEFIARFTQETKQRCSDLIKDLGLSKEWFSDSNAIEECVQNSSRENKHMETAEYYAKLCDHLLFLSTEGARGAAQTYFESRKHFQKECQKSLWPIGSVVDNYALWDLTQSGLFSMIDYLIVLKNNHCLCSIHKDVKMRDDFSAHAGLVTGHHGAINHDFGHTESLRYFLYYCGQRNNTAGGYINDCLAEKNTRNILEFGQKILIIFINLHENEYPYVDSLSEALFHQITSPDDTFLKIIPFFLGTSIDTGEATQAQDMSAEDVIDTLYAWREKYIDAISQRYCNNKKPRTS